MIERDVNGGAVTGAEDGMLDGQRAGASAPYAGSVGTALAGVEVAGGLDRVGGIVRSVHQEIVKGSFISPATGLVHDGPGTIQHIFITTPR